MLAPLGGVARDAGASALSFRVWGQTERKPHASRRRQCVSENRGWGIRATLPGGVTQSRSAVVLQFAAVDEAAFTLWLMVADAKELPTLDELIGRPAWQRRAACRGLGTQGFVIGRGGRGYTKAKELSAGCSVRQECLEVALADEDWSACGEEAPKANGGRCEPAGEWRSLWRRSFFGGNGHGFLCLHRLTEGGIDSHPYFLRVI
jgi:hypothetical protein